MADVSLDISTLRLLSNRQRYEKYARMVPEGTVNDATQSIIKRLGEFFKGRTCGPATPSGTPSRWSSGDWPCCQSTSRTRPAWTSR